MIVMQGEPVRECAARAQVPRQRAFPAKQRQLQAEFQAFVLMAKKVYKLTSDLIYNDRILKAKIIDPIFNKNLPYKNEGNGRTTTSISID